MGRTRKFCREDVLARALPIFWKKGFGDTGLQDLEQATGVNKSGLYSEFKDKQEIFVESLRHYYANRKTRLILAEAPQGWHNIETFFKYFVQGCDGEQRGCFGVNSLREMEQLPAEAREIIEEGRAQIRLYLTQNLSAEKTKLPPEAIADLLLTFISGLCIELNIKTAKPTLVRKIDDFLTAVRVL